MTTGCLHWGPDEEPYKNGEHEEDIKSKEELALVENLVDGVELDMELSLHYCPVCETIVSFCANINPQLRNRRIEKRDHNEIIAEQKAQLIRYHVENGLSHPDLQDEIDKAKELAAEEVK